MENFLPEIDDGPIFVGMSGGVDSSVTAAYLKERGHEVIGLFMKNWDENEELDECPAAKDYKDVEAVCKKIGIECYSVEFIEEYRKNVFDGFIKDLKLGLTPNPDILCNREVKFKYFYDYAMEMGAKYLATGHYGRIQKIDGEAPKLLKGIDHNKDQTYFLYTLKEKKLNNILFPLGEMTKPQVRELARKYDLPTQAKKDSYGICFIGKKHFPTFIQNYISPKPGDFKRLDESTVGTHSGAHFYTLGQRKGLGLGGAGDAWFVVKKDMDKNIVYVERGKDHPSLYHSHCSFKDESWVKDDFIPVLPFKCHVKTRYRQADQACTIQQSDNGIYTVDFDVPQRSMTPGQSLVFYLKDECIGGAFIDKVY
jgi:tRNA-uridine 2-sulfurtransferase